MGHDISITNNVAAFADSRASNGKVDAWHKLGQPVGHVMSTQEALAAAHLAEWDVRKEPVFIHTEEGQRRVAGQFATVFTNPVDGSATPLGVVGSRYVPIQNESLAAFGDALVDESGAHWETAGALKDYRRVFLTMKLPRTMVLEDVDGQRDISEWYLALFNSHDGSSPMFGITTSVRVVCANTAAAAIEGAQSRFSVRHTSGYRSSVTDARNALRLAFEYEAAFEEEVQRLFRQPFDVDEMTEFANDLVGVEKPKPGEPARTGPAARKGNEAGHIVKLFIESPSIVNTPIAATRYGAYNAVTEFVDHHQSVTQRGGGDAIDRGALRAARTILSSARTEGLKVRAFKMLAGASV